MIAAVLAHQGGWDEILMVAAPIVLFAVILGVANRRARRLAAEIGAPEAPASEVGATQATGSGSEAADTRPES